MSLRKDRVHGRNEPLRLESQTARFEEIILPHLDAAYNLARWLLRNGTEAEDLVQEAYLRAWKGFAGFRGEDARGGLLAIVRNACYSWLRQNRRQELAVEFDEAVHSEESDVPEPEPVLERNASSRTLEKALGELPAEFREAIVCESSRAFRIARGAMRQNRCGRPPRAHLCPGHAPSLR